jgi:hypothetical protein
MAKSILSAALVAALVAGAADFASAQSSAEVTVYTTREQALIQPLLSAFSARSGTKVNTVFVKDGLVERVVGEQLRHRARRVDFRDAEAERKSLLERQVVGGRIALRVQRRDHCATVLDGIAELDASFDHLDSFHL